jgi:hypothetical protein
MVPTVAKIIPVPQPMLIASYAGQSPPTCRSQSPTKFELAINLKSAKTLGITIHVGDGSGGDPVKRHLATQKVWTAAGSSGSTAGAPSNQRRC